jgi:hypothetical protein
MLRHDIGEYPAAHVKLGGQAHEARLRDRHNQRQSKGAAIKAIKGVSLALNFRISHSPFKIQNQIDHQLAHPARAWLSACPALSRWSYKFHPCPSKHGRLG